MRSRVKNFSSTIFRFSQFHRVPSKHFIVVSTLSFGWYDAATWDNVKSTLKQRCVFQRWKWQRLTTSIQRCVFQCWYERRYTTSKQCCHFPRQVSQHWPTSKQCGEKDHFQKEPKQIISNRIHWIQWIVLTIIS